MLRRSGSVGGAFWLVFSNDILYAAHNIRMSGQVRNWDSSGKED